MNIDSSEVRHLQVDLSQAPAEVRAKAPLAFATWRERTTSSSP